MKDLAFDLLIVVGILTLGIFVGFRACYSGNVEPLENQIAELQEQQEKPPHTLIIDDDSGFLSSNDIMASYQAFNAKDGVSVWVRIDRRGFGQTHEFSVATIQEAEMILLGLVE